MIDNISKFQAATKYQHSYHQHCGLSLSVSTVNFKPSFYQSLSLHSHLSLATPHLL